MTAAHTPGPWLHIGVTAHDSIVRKDGGDTIAFVPHNMPRNEYESNARLIAAAPDMLTALRAATGYMLNARIDLQTGTPKRTTINTLEGGLRLLEAAIAKAADQPAFVPNDGKK